MSGDNSDSNDKDFSIVYPPNLLAQKAKKTEGTLEDLLANAENMVAGMKDEFEALVDRALLQLPTIRDQQWRNEAARLRAIQAFCNIVNVLKGKSGSFGYGILGDIADLFRDYLRETPPHEQKVEAVTNYIGALQAVWKQRITGDGGKVGQQIVADLSKLNERAKRPPA